MVRRALSFVLPLFRALYKLIFVASLASCFSATLLVSQVSEVTNMTSTPIAGSGHDYLNDLDEIINPANGSVSIRIAAPTPHERRSATPVYAYTYDTNGQFNVGFEPLTLPISGTEEIVAYGPYIESFAASTGNTFGKFGAGGVTYQKTTTNYCSSVSSSGGCATTLYCNYLSNFIATDPSGGRHDLGVGVELYGVGFSPEDCGSLGFQLFSAGGDERYKIDTTCYSGSTPVNCSTAVGSSAIIDLHGNALVSGFEDSNGNFLNTDGRTWTSPFSYGYINSFLMPTSMSVPGFSTSYTYGAQAGTSGNLYGTTNNPLNATLRYNPNASIGVPNNCQLPPIGGTSQNGRLSGGASSVTLPNSQQYLFTYDPTYGFVSSITYPTGATVQYTWAIDSQSEVSGFKGTGFTAGQPVTPSNQICIYQIDMPRVQSRIVKFDGVTPALEQDFVYTTQWNTNYSSWGSSNPWISKTTTVTTTDLLRPGHPSFKTKYTYIPMQASHALIGATTTFPVPLMPVESKIEHEDSVGNVLMTENKVWNTPDQLAAECDTLDNNQTSGIFYTYASYNWGSITTVGFTTSQAAYTNLPTDVAEYDYGAIIAICQQPPATTKPIRETKTTYFNLGPTPYWPHASGIQDRPQSVQIYGNGVLLSETDYAYDEASSPLTPVTPAPYGHDETNYGPSPATTYARGNPTTITKKCWQGSVACTNSVWKIGYDTTGMPVSVIDADGNQATISYADSFTSGNGTPTQNTNSYVTKITKPVTNGVPHIQTFQWDFNQGKLGVSTDENGKQSFLYYNDPWNRLTEADYPDGGVTKHKYVDSPPISVTTCELINGSASSLCDYTNLPSGWKTSVDFKDGFGHTIQSELASDPDGATSTVMNYDGLGRPYQVYNPTRCATPTINCGTEPTWGLTTNLFDALRRPCLVVPADFSGAIPTVCSSTPTTGLQSISYSGNQVTTTDEVGNQRTSQTDVLGHLTNIWEAPNNAGYNFPTIYSYDALGDLLSVTQNGNNSATARVRTFVYDSLSRLTSSSNPESGTITYAYDPNGNELTKTAPRPGQTGTATEITSFTYDALNRLTNKTFTPSLGTGNFLYGYDGVAIPSGCSTAVPSITSPTNLIGRRSSMCVGNSASSWSYDAMGRPLAQSRRNKGSSVQVYTIGYSYFKDGSTNTLTYPSGDILTYMVGGAGRPTFLSDSNGNNFAGYTGAPATYAPQGGLTGMTSGQTATFAGILSANTFNTRLQPVEISAAVGTTPFLKLCYNFHVGIATGPPCNFAASANGDNGNVFQILDRVDATRNENIIYDPLNRIRQANTVTMSGANCWGEVFGIDAWGNLTSRSAPSGGSGCTTLSLSATATVSNQLSILTYDAAGNVTNDGGLNQPTYNGGNQMATDAGYTYSYDADGIRIEKSAGTTGTMYWPGADGNYLAETGLTGAINEEYVFFNGQRLARIDRPSGTVHYYFSDNLQSTSVVTDANGVVQEHYYYDPYGAMLFGVGSDPNHYQFNGKERDTESGLDEFGARYYASASDRFMIPDWSESPSNVPYAAFINPQSLNLYAYVNNNPLTYRDWGGHSCDPDTITTDTKTGIVTVAAGKCHPDWWQFQGVTRWVGRHPKTVKVAFGVVNAATIISGVLDGGASELAVPEELAVEETIEELGETAVEAEAEAAETAETTEATESAGTDGETTAESAQMKKLSSGEIKQLQERGIDPHDLKPNSKYDLFKNKDGDIFVKPKAGNGPGEPTGLNIKGTK